MARTHRTTHRSTGRLPIGQLAPQNVPQPQESQPDVPQEASQEEEPFEIELVVPESPTAQDSPGEEQQQLGDQDTEDKTNKEHLHLHHHTSLVWRSSCELAPPPSHKPKTPWMQKIGSRGLKRNS
jgi:hypothetical protein